MNPDITDLITDELRATRRKLDQIIELLRHYVGDESHAVYQHIGAAALALEVAEVEVVKFRSPAD